MTVGLTVALTVPCTDTHIDGPYRTVVIVDIYCYMQQYDSDS